MSKQLILALGAGGAAAAAVVASAASIGTVDSTNLAAGTGVVAACDDDGVGVSYTTAFDAGNYEVASVDLSGIATACNAQAVKITLYDGTGATVGSTSGTVSGATGTFTVAAPPLAEDVVGVAVVISGAATP